MGSRPSLPDSLPIIDRSPLRQRFFRFGHAHFGLTEAPTTGKLIAEMVGGRPTSIGHNDAPSESGGFPRQRSLAYHADTASSSPDSAY